MRVKVTVNCVYEFDADGSHYPEGFSDAEILDYEKTTFQDEPGLIFDLSESKLTVLVEEVKL